MANNKIFIQVIIYIYLLASCNNKKVYMYAFDDKFIGIDYLRLYNNSTFVFLENGIKTKGYFLISNDTIKLDFLDKKNARYLRINKDSTISNINSDYKLRLKITQNSKLHKKCIE